MNLHDIQPAEEQLFTRVAIWLRDQYGTPVDTWLVRHNPDSDQENWYPYQYSTNNGRRWHGAAREDFDRWVRQMDTGQAG